MKMKNMNRKDKPDKTRIAGICTHCSRSTPCGGYHIYVAELEHGASYRFYVGHTGKTVGQRMDDNWEKYGSQGNGPKLIRENFRRMRMDLVPEDSIVSPSREDAEHLEAELADELRDQGHKVKGPTNRRRPMASDKSEYDIAADLGFPPIKEYQDEVAARGYETNREYRARLREEGFRFPARQQVLTSQEVHVGQGKARRAREIKIYRETVARVTAKFKGTMAEVKANAPTFKEKQRAHDEARGAYESRTFLRATLISKGIEPDDDLDVMREQYRTYKMSWWIRPHHLGGVRRHRAVAAGVA